MRIANRITGIAMGIALIGLVAWFRLGVGGKEALFSYLLRTQSADRDYILIFPVIGGFVGVVMATLVIGLGSRYNKRRRSMGLGETDPIWIVLAAFVVPLAASIVCGHYYG